MSEAVERVFHLAKEAQAQVLDLKFMDFPGLWQHFSVPISELNQELFESGLGFDGSSIRGWKAINESDMLVVPDPETAVLDPFLKHPTVSMICDIVEPSTRQPYTKCPRHVARKAQQYLKNSGMATVCYMGCEAEFFIFDEVRFDQTPNSGFYMVDSREGRWNSGREENPNLGYKPRYKEGYFPVPPTDSYQDLRSEMMLHLINAGLKVEAQHHEVASGGQAEIDIAYDSLLKTADNLLFFKYVVKNTALQHGKTATFMPKPIFGDNGSGMHTHVSLWKESTPLFAGTEYAGLSPLALHFIGGLLKHAPALCAFTNPTTNSYKRLVPGFEAPVNLAYSQRNRSAAIRIPMISPSPESRRIEFRCPDSSCNPYLALSAILMAGLDGILNQIDPGPPLDKDIYDLEPEELEGVPTTPATLDRALEALREDHTFLLKGEVFTEDVIDTWIWYKGEMEVDALRLRPHPWEFALYYDI